MRRLLLLVVAALFSASAAFADQTLGNLQTLVGTSVAGTFGSAVTGGNLVVATFKYSTNGRTVTFSDTCSNSYSLAVKHTVGGDELGIYYSASVATCSPFTVTASISGAATNNLEMTLHEYGGMKATSVLDQTQKASGTSTAPDSGNVTTTQGAEVLVGAFEVALANTLSVGTNFGNFVASPSAAGSHRLAGQDRHVTATGTYSSPGTIASSVAWLAVIATFKKAPCGRLTLLGVGC